MSNENYRENEGGARLEEVWRTSIERFTEWGSVMSPRRLSSGWNGTTALSKTVPAAHIQEQSRVPCVAFWWWACWESCVTDWADARPPTTRIQRTKRQTRVRWINPWFITFTVAGPAGPWYWTAQQRVKIVTPPKSASSR